MARRRWETMHKGGGAIGQRVVTAGTSPVILHMDETTPTAMVSPRVHV